METLLLVFASIIAGFAWHRRMLLGEVAQLRRQVAALQQAREVRPEWRVYLAPYEAPGATERWAGGSIPPGEYSASQRLYNEFGRGYLN